jgi:hypothetical protein
MLGKFKNYIRKTWRLLNSLLGRSQEQPKIESIAIDGNLIIDNQEMANHFNTFFSSLGNELDNKILLQAVSDIANYKPKNL